LALDDVAVEVRAEPTGDIWQHRGGRRPHRRLV
jgi:hypothetical protein